MQTPGPHRRKNLLSGEWILVSAQRTKRPWQGQVEDVPAEQVPRYVPNCYLCPGNERADGTCNPGYESTFAFDNDFPALLDVADTPSRAEPLLIREPETGRCRVLCFSPRHDLTLATMPPAAVAQVIDLWANEYESLGSSASINHVQIFENKGAMMGCSNPHPHGQVWAQSSIPDEPAREMTHMQAHFRQRRTPLLIDYVETELAANERVVSVNDTFVAVVPFWATWPFETLLLPRRNVSNLLELDARERADLAAAVRDINIRYDNLFEAPFPYSAGLHQAPTDGQSYPFYTMHMHFYPPLLRSATVRKFMVGYEMLAGAQRDIAPELSARYLRDTAVRHYTVSGTHK